MAKIAYTKHAERRMALRQVTKGQVEAALGSPSSRVQEGPRKWRVRKKMGSRILTVVYLEGDPRLVISVWWKS